MRRERPDYRDRRQEDPANLGGAEDDRRAQGADPVFVGADEEGEDPDDPHQHPGVKPEEYAGDERPGPPPPQGGQPEADPMEQFAPRGGAVTGAGHDRADEDDPDQRQGERHPPQPEDRLPDRSL